MPRIQQADFSPVPLASNLRILLRDGVSSTPHEVQGFLTPTPERLDGERDETSSRQGPSWIPPMFVFGGSCSGCTILIGRFVQVGAALGVSDDNVPVDKRVRWRTLEAVVLPRLLNL